MALFNKTDFINIVPMSVNIPDANVDLHCNDAQSLDTKPTMPVRVSNNAIDLIDDLISSESDPSTRPQLWDFYNSFLLPYMVCLAHARFLVWHGRNVAQFGLRVNSEDTSESVTDEQRADLIASSEHKANIYLAQLKVELVNKNFTFDSIPYMYKCDNKPKVKTRIYAI